MIVMTGTSQPDWKGSFVRAGSADRIENIENVDPVKRQISANFWELCSGQVRFAIYRF